MSPPLPIYVLSVPGASHDRLLGMLGDDATVLDPETFLQRWDVLAPGFVLADGEGVAPGDLLSVAERISVAAHGWIFGLVGRGEPQPSPVVGPR